MIYPRFTVQKISSYNRSARHVLSVVLIGNYPPDGQISMLRLTCLFRSILFEAGLQAKVIHPVDRIGKMRYFIPQLEKWFGYIDKYVVFPFELAIYMLLHKNDPNIVYHITDHSNAVYSYILNKRPYIVTCNDTLGIRSALGEIPENPIRLTGILQNNAILSGLRRSPRIVCISENTASELRRLIDVNSSQISVALLPLNYSFKRLPAEQAYESLYSLDPGLKSAIHGDFILHVGGNQWYKNRAGVVQIYAELLRLRKVSKQPPIPLILVGKPPSVELSELIRILEISQVFLVTSVTNHQLNAFYSLATFLLFPSLQEGFGWPIVEAMACGCPVVTTDRAPMTEAGGDAAVYIPSTDFTTSAKILNHVLSWSAADRNSFIERGYANVKRFRRDDLASHYISAYHDVVMQD